ncbi:MAG: SMC-Scp complex subunit ScpB [candidate division NC10 bacterium]|nr:SMC-Scp complex subunit ScpB [candidate division NC10 bacterium]
MRDPKAILEAVLFVAEEPLSLERLHGVLEEYTKKELETALRELQDSYLREGRGLQVIEVAGGFRLATRPELAPWILKLKQARPTRLSRAAMETLAIIAYKQAITKAEIEAIRGVEVDGVLRTLLEKDLVRIVGRKKEAGRPILYGTSKTFLEYFGFKDLSELPSLNELEELVPQPTLPGVQGDRQDESSPEGLLPAGGALDPSLVMGDGGATKEVGGVDPDR